MKPRSLPIAAALSLAAACSSTRVSTTRDPAAPFARYRTYALAEGQIEIQAALSEQSPFRGHIVSALNRELGGKGLRHDQDDPDLIVTYSARARDWHEYRADWDRGQVDRVFRRTRSEGKIIVEVIDADTRRLVWRGTAMAKDERIRTRKFIDDTMHELMAQYPSRLPAG